MDARANPIRFGTDGWRGIIAEDFTFPNLRRVAHATTSLIKERARFATPSVLVGYDRRFLSRSFAECVADVFSERGLHVQIASTSMPTPALSVSVTHRKAAWGIMITASHNPALYNGFKLKDAHGRSAPPEITQQIESLLDRVTSDQIPSRKRSLPEFNDDNIYDAYLKSRLDWKLVRSFKARVVFDYLYGTAAGIPERLLKGSALKVFSLHSAEDPLFGGLHPEPIESNLLALQSEVRRRHAAVGIALDGDADRLGVVDERGAYLTPHQVFPLLVLHGIEHKGWRGKIVQAVSLGALGERIAKAYNLPFEEVPVGFKHVAERMLREDILAGGEESGGYAVRGGLPERDGILNGLLFIEMLAARKKSPSRLLKELEKRFGAARFKRVDITLPHPLHDRAAFAQSLVTRVPDRLGGQRVKEVRTLDGIKVILQNGSWVLLRPSGTEPLIRTYAETENATKTNSLLTWAKQLIAGMTP